MSVAACVEDIVEKDECSSRSVYEVRITVACRAIIMGNLSGDIACFFACDQPYAVPRFCCTAASAWWDGAREKGYRTVCTKALPLQVSEMGAVTGGRGKKSCKGRETIFQGSDRQILFFVVAVHLTRSRRNSREQAEFGLSRCRKRSKQGAKGNGDLMRCFSEVMTYPW